MQQDRTGGRWFGVAVFVASFSFGPAADAQPPIDRLFAGKLKCTVESRLEIVVSANRDLTCSYFRAADHRAELYTGYTGIIGGGLGVAAAYAVDFQVFAAIPGDQAALEGDFQSRSDGAASPGELSGGRSNGISLLPYRDPATPHSLDAAPVLAPINAIAGFGYLHLIYAGVVPLPGSRHAVRRRTH